MSRMARECWQSLIGTYAAPAAVVLIVLASGIWAWSQGYFAVFQNTEMIRSFALSLGPWAPLGFIFLNMVQVIFAPIPGHGLNMVSGFLFGPGLGTLYSLAGLLLGSTIVLVLVRRLGRPFAIRLAGKENLERFDQFARQRGPLFLLLIFLIPFLPDDLAGIAAGLTPLRITHILFLQLVGRTPGLFVANYIGWRAADLALWQWVVFGLVILFIAGLFWRFQGPIMRLAVAADEKLKRSVGAPDG